MIKPSLDRLDKTYLGQPIYQRSRKPHFIRVGGDKTIESYFRADVQTYADGSVQPRSHTTHIFEALVGACNEYWIKHTAAIPQPALLIRGTDAFGLQDSPPIVSDNEAKEIVQRMANCRYREVPGNPITKLYGESARRIVEALSQFVFPE